MADETTQTPHPVVPPAAPRWRRNVRLLLRIGLPLVAVGLVVYLIQWSNRVGRELRIQRTAGYCGSFHMRQVMGRLADYSRSHGGRLPDELADLLLEPDFTSSTVIFLCPGSDDTPAHGDTPEERAQALRAGGHCSFNYVGRGLSYPAGPDTLILYERLTDHGGGPLGMNVAFGNGCIAWIPAADVPQLLSSIRAATRPSTAPSQ